MIELKTYILPNGFTLLYVPYEQYESASCILVGKAGSSYETDNEIGVAHMLEHLVFDGSKKYQNQDLLQGVIVDIGGRRGGGTDPYTVRYSAKVLKKDIEKAFDYLAEVTMNPLLTKEDLDKEKKVIVQELNKKMSNPLYDFWNDFSEMQFPKQRIAKDNVGSVEDVQNINIETVRGFFTKHYTASNFILAVCGNLDFEVLKVLCEKYFSPMKPGSKNKNKIWDLNRNHQVLNRNREDRKQAYFDITWWGYDTNDPRRFVVSYLGNTLGRARLSRLHRKLREEMHLVYSTGAHITFGNTHGSFGIDASLFEESFEQAIIAVKEILKDISEHHISDEEFERAKNYAIADHVFMSEDPFDVGAFYVVNMLNDQNKTLESELAGYTKVTKEDVLRAAQEIFSKPPRIGVMSKSLTEEDVRRAWGS